MYGFPLQKLRELMTRSARFEGELHKEMLPVVVLLSKEIDFSHIPVLVWNRIKREVEYFRVPRGNHHTVENLFVIVMEGSIMVDGAAGGQGYYKLIGGKGLITGPTKYITSTYPFEDIRESERRLSEVINKGIKNDGPTAFDKALMD
jgi:hypothetical protein